MKDGPSKANNFVTPVILAIVVQIGPYFDSNLLNIFNVRNAFIRYDFVKVFFRKELFTINMSITDIDSIANELSEVFASLDFVF